MELLFEYQDSRRRLNPPSSEAVVECILEEIRKFDDKASISLGNASKDDAKPPADSEYLLQKWSQKWGAYIDVTKLEEVEDGDKLTAIPKPTRAYSVKEVTKKAVDICRKVGKPSESDRKLLNKLYPACGSKSLPRKRKFDPTEESVAEKNRAKKKAAIPRGGKPRSITAVLLKHPLTKVPKGGARKQLANEGRIKKMQIRRSMTPSAIKQVIANCFSTFESAREAKFLKCEQDNSLTILKNQVLNGDETAEVAGGGSLYLTECETIDSQVAQTLLPQAVGKSTVVEQADRLLASLKAPPPSVSSDCDSEGGEVEVTGYDPPSTNESGNGPGPSSQDPKDDHMEMSVNETNPLEERRRLIAEQDAVFEQSLEIDREKVCLATEMENRKERMEHVREVLRAKFDVIQREGVRLAFRMPSGSRIENQFPLATPLKELYGYTFAVGNVDPPFGLYTSYPRKEIPAQDCSVQEFDLSSGSLISVECGFGDFDPLIFDKAEPVQCHNTRQSRDGMPFMITLQLAQTRREQYMESLNLKYGTHHKIQRQDVYVDLMKLYQTSKDEIMDEYPFRVEFVGEKAVDIGGVSRDMFSGFFEEAYRNLFEGTSLVTPAIHPGTDLSSLPVLGSIVSHAYLVSGTLPIRIAFPCLAAMLLSECQLPEEVLVNTFIDSLSVHDAMVFKQAFGEVRDQLPSFSAEVLSGLHHVLSFYGCREVPRPQTLKRLVLQIANFEFKMKPAAAIASIRSGIPTKHLPFWEKMSIADFYSTYTALSVSPAKVLKMMDDCLTSNPCEERVLSYLRQYVGNMHLDELRAFLRYITGSCVCTAEGIAVTFNRLDGFGRRPIAHTCSCTLELPTTYVTYTDFVTEFQLVLRNEDYAWSMDAV